MPGGAAGGSLCAPGRRSGAKPSALRFALGPTARVSGLMIASPELVPLFVFAFLGPPLFSTNQAEKILFSWGPHFSLGFRGTLKGSKAQLF